MSLVVHDRLHLEDVWLAPVFSPNTPFAPVNAMRVLVGGRDGYNSDRFGAHFVIGGGGTPCHIQHSPNTPTTGLRERGNDTSKSTGRSGQQKAATRRNMRREERVTVQGPIKEQQPDGMSHRGGGLGVVGALYPSLVG